MFQYLCTIFSLPSAAELCSYLLCFIGCGKQVLHPRITVALQTGEWKGSCKDVGRSPCPTSACGAKLPRNPLSCIPFHFDYSSPLSPCTLQEECGFGNLISQKMLMSTCWGRIGRRRKKCLSRSLLRQLACHQILRASADDRFAGLRLNTR
eukprot:2206190-Rhodomonas_salina.1